MIDRTSIHRHVIPQVSLAIQLERLASYAFADAFDKIGRGPNPLPSFGRQCFPQSKVGRRNFKRNAARMSSAVDEFATIPAAWTRRHLLDLESLSAEEIRVILDAAVQFKEATGGCKHKISVLAGKTLANLFFENSTRTRTSFSLAMRRLGGDTVDFSASGSSLSKGETFIDTAKNIEAMNVDIVCVRHQHVRHAETAGREPGLLGDQRRRRPARASDPGFARHHDDPRTPWPARWIDRGAGRRHRAQPHRAQQHLGTEKTGGACDRVRAIDVGFAAVGAHRRGNFLQPRRNLAALRRAEFAAHSIRAAIRPGRSPRSANTHCCTR